MLEIRHYVTLRGDDPFGDWLDTMRDRNAAYKIIARVNRLALGNPGDSRALDGGVFELRVNVGPGYRVYFARVGKVIMLLLCGGDKSTQQKDIDHAKRNLKNYQSREAAQKGKRTGREPPS